MGLSLNIHRHAGIEFNGEFVLVDGDVFNQPTNQRFVVFSQGGGLFLQEGAHVGDVLFLLVTSGVFQMKLLLFGGIIADLKNFYISLRIVGVLF